MVGCKCADMQMRESVLNWCTVVYSEQCTIVHAIVSMVNVSMPIVFDTKSNRFESNRVESNCALLWTRP